MTLWIISFSAENIFSKLGFALIGQLILLLSLFYLFVKSFSGFFRSLLIFGVFIAPLFLFIFSNFTGPGAFPYFLSTCLSFFSFAFFLVKRDAILFDKSFLIALRCLFLLSFFLLIVSNLSLTNFGFQEPLAISDLALNARCYNTSCAKTFASFFTTSNEFSLFLFLTYVIFYIRKEALLFPSSVPLIFNFLPFLLQFDSRLFLSGLLIISLTPPIFVRIHSILKLRFSKEFLLFFFIFTLMLLSLFYFRSNIPIFLNLLNLGPSIMERLPIFLEPFAQHTLPGGFLSNWTQAGGSEYLIQAIYFDFGLLGLLFLTFLLIRYLLFITLSIKVLYPNAHLVLLILVLAFISLFALFKAYSELRSPLYFLVLALSLLNPLTLLKFNKHTFSA